MTTTFKSKTELIDLVQKQVNVTLKNDNNTLNTKRKILYTQIERTNRIAVLGLLNKYKVRYEEHVGNYYFINI